MGTVGGVRGLCSSEAPRLTQNAVYASRRAGVWARAPWQIVVTGAWQSRKPGRRKRGKAASLGARFHFWASPWQHAGVWNVSTVCFQRGRRTRNDQDHAVVYITGPHAARAVPGLCLRAVLLAHLGRGERSLPGAAAARSRGAGI